MEVITQLVTSVGFPIAMCLLMGYWVKKTHDDHREDIQQLQSKHTEIVDSITNVMYENTILTQKIVDKLDERSNENDE